MTKLWELFVAISNRNDPKMIKLISEMTVEEVNANHERLIRSTNTDIGGFHSIRNSKIVCTALHVACLTNNATAVAMLLAFKGIEVNAKFEGPTTTDFGNSSRVVEWPGVDQAELSNKNYDGYTPIMVAAELKHKEAYELLVRDQRVDCFEASVSLELDLAEIFAEHNWKFFKLEVFQDHKNNFEKLLDSGEDSDFNIICGEETFRCHKIILFAQSNVLRTMYNSQMKESREGSMTITDLTPEIVKQFIKFIYTGSIDVEEAKENAPKLLEVADRYELKGLTKLCEGELLSTINNNNVLEMVIKADMYHADKLKKACMKWIVKNRTKFVKPEGWREELAKFPTLMLEIMEALTSRDLERRQRRQHGPKW